MRRAKLILLKSKVLAFLLQAYEKILFRQASEILRKTKAKSKVSHLEFSAHVNHQANFELCNFVEVKNNFLTPIFALYLPQFQPNEVNDKSWGEGFTEWTNLASSRPLFKGHVQPIIPGKFGFYDLRHRETIREQIKLAKLAGLSGFIIMIYWFENYAVMSESLTDLVEICNEEEFYFAFEWANESWTKGWDGMDSQVILKQNKLLSFEGTEKLVTKISSYIETKYYFKFREKPIFFIYNPGYFENDAVSIIKSAFKAKKLDIYLIGMQTFDLSWEKIMSLGYDETCEYFPHNMTSFSVAANRTLLPFTISVAIESYPETVKKVISSVLRKGIPSCFPSWDNSPRRKLQGSNVFVDCNSIDFANWVEDSINRSKDREKNGLLNMVLVNAWNEWGEGAVLEPSRNSGYAYLNSINRILKMYD